MKKKKVQQKIKISCVRVDPVPDDDLILIDDDMLKFLEGKDYYI